MKTVVLTQSFLQSPEKVLRRYLEKKVYRQAGNAKVSIDHEPGGLYRVADRRGKILRYRKTEMIIHTIRYRDWMDEISDAVVIVLAEPRGKGTNLRVSIADIPDSDVERFKADFRGALQAIRSYRSKASRLRTGDEPDEPDEPGMAGVDTGLSAETIDSFPAGD